MLDGAITRTDASRGGSFGAPVAAASLDMLELVGEVTTAGSDGTGGAEACAAGGGKRKSLFIVPLRSRLLRFMLESSDPLASTSSSPTLAESRRAGVLGFTADVGSGSSGVGAKACVRARVSALVGDIGSDVVRAMGGMDARFAAPLPFCGVMPPLELVRVGECARETWDMDCGRMKGGALMGALGVAPR